MVSNIKDFSSSVRDILFFNRTYYLSSGSINEFQLSDVPQLKNLVLRMISTRQEYDTLIAEGYDFKPWHSTFRKRLTKGAIAQCIFVEKELAHMSWVAVSEDGQKGLGEPPVKVDFANNEVLAGGFWTRPAYRGYGLAPYASGKRLEYLKGLGKTASRGAIRRDNTASLRVREKRVPKNNTRIYAEGRHLNILGWKFWRETPVKSEEETQTH